MAPWSGPGVGEGAGPASLCGEYGLLLGADVTISSALSCWRPTLPAAGAQGLGLKGVCVGDGGLVAPQPLLQSPQMGHSDLEKKITI